jgi:hypothetical protein
MPFEGQAINPEGPVGAGLDSILIQDGAVVSFGSGCNFDQDYEIEGIRTLGFHGDRFFKSMGYTASVTIETYVLREKNVSGALKTPGWQSTGEFTMNTAGEFDFVIADVTSLNILFTLLGVKLSTEAVQFPARGLNTKTTTWRCSRILPGLETS